MLAADKYRGYDLNGDRTSVKLQMLTAMIAAALVLSGAGGWGGSASMGSETFGQIIKAFSLHRAGSAAGKERPR